MSQCYGFHDWEGLIMKMDNVYNGILPRFYLGQSSIYIYMCMCSGSTVHWIILRLEKWNCTWSALSADCIIYMACSLVQSSVNWTD